MNPEQIYTINIIHKNSNVIYALCSMKFDEKKNDFIYRFKYPKQSKREVFNFTTKKIMGRFDHITFHSIDNQNKAKVHVRLEKTKQKIGIREHDENFLPKSYNSITPLLIHSIYDSDDQYFLPIVENPSLANNTLIYPGPISLALFLVPSNSPNTDLLFEMYRYVQHLKKGPMPHGYLAGQIDLENGWRIDCILTDWFLEIPDEFKNMNYNAAFAYCDLQHVFEFRLVNNKSIGLYQNFQQVSSMRQTKITFSAY